MDEIVITGIGIISACGIGREAFWQNCLRGSTGIAPIESFDTSAYHSHLGAEARDFNPKDFIPPLRYRRLSRVSRLAVAASIEALQDSALVMTPQSAPSIGVLMGTRYGSTSQTDDFFVGMLKEGPEGANPSLFPDTVPNAPASQVSIYHGVKGPNTTFSHNEVSGEQAMAYACRLLREGRTEALLVGSVDEMSAVLFHSYARLRALSPRGAHEEGMRPFDRRRNGRVLEEVRQEVDLLLQEKNFIFFVDDNIIGNPAYARDLFSLLKDFRIKWLSQASVHIAEDDDLLRKAGESGCYGLLIGFESLCQETLERHLKTSNRVHRYRELIRKIHGQGIGIEGSFIFGSDDEDPSVFRQVVDFCEETQIDAAVFAILTPYPGTRIYEQLAKENRILTRDWDLYDMGHVVFRPHKMTMEQLQEGHDWANQRFYSYPSMLKPMLKRLWPIRRSQQVFIPSNWGRRRAWRSLAKSISGG